MFSWKSNTIDLEFAMSTSGHEGACERNWQSYIGDIQYIQNIPGGKNVNADDYKDKRWGQE